MSNNWTLEIDAERIAWLTCDMAGASTNVLSGTVLRELKAKLTESAAFRSKHARWARHDVPALARRARARA